LVAIIKHVHERLRGNPGVRRVHAELVTLGHTVAPKRVWRLMKAAGLQGRDPKPWKRTTIAGDAAVPAPDLIGRDLTAEGADQRWCGDRLQASSRRMRSCIIWRLGFRQSSFRHITRVPQHLAPHAWARPLLSWHALVPFHLSAPGKPSDPRTTLRVPPG
jgi:hypothetical protein